MLLVKSVDEPNLYSSARIFQLTNLA